MEEMALNWNTRDKRERGRRKNIWKKTVTEEIAKEGFHRTGLKCWKEIE